MRHQAVSISVFALSALCAVQAAKAQIERSGGGEAQKIMQQYQQLAAERTSLQAQLAQIKKDLDSAKTDLGAVTKERDALKARAGGSVAAIAQATSAKQTAEQSLEQSKQRMSELVTRFRDTAQNLKEVEADRAKTRRELSERSAAFDRCAADNFSLYEINRNVLDRYEHVGLFTRISAAEPFTKITRTRNENLADAYRARAEELRVKEPTAREQAAR
jgi:chromosome segregation ATPase